MIDVPDNLNEPPDGRENPPEALYDSGGREPAGKQPPLDVESALLHVVTLLGDIEARLQPIEAAVERGQWDSDAPGKDLDAWVRWLTTTYSLRGQLAHWQDLPSSVNELTALRQSHKAAYAPKAAATAKVAWHESLARLLPRLDEHRQRHSKETNSMASIAEHHNEKQPPSG